MRHTALATATVVVLVAGIVVGCANLPPSASDAGPSKGGGSHSALTSGIDLAGMDRSVNASESLYGLTNGGWLHATDIPPGRAQVGTFADLNSHNEQQQRELIEAAEEHPEGETARKVGDFYAACMDTAHRDELRATPLNAELTAVDKLATPADITNYLGTLQRGDISDPVKLEVRPDISDSTDNILMASQGRLTVPDRDFYVSGDPQRAAQRAGYRTYVAKMLSLLGRPDADAAAGAVLDLETRLARLQLTDSQYLAQAKFVKLDLAQAKARTGLDWKSYLAAAGLTNAEQVVLTQPEYFSSLAAMLSSVPVATWKSYLRWHLLSDAAPYLSTDFVEAREAFLRTLPGASQNPVEQWQRGVACVNTGMGEALGELYIQKFYDRDAEKRMDRLTTNVVNAFKTSIDTLTWMSPATKAVAREKLTKLVVKLGFPHWWRDWSLLQVNRTDLMGNLRRAADLETRRDQEKVDRAFYAGEWFTTPQTTDVRYDPMHNEITIPGGLLQAPFFDVQAEESVNYGAIGAIIAREISSAFDDEGRLHDPVGLPKNWWSASDAAAFTAKTKPLVARYDALSPIPGTHVNGQLTFAENVSDLAGLEIAWKAYQASLASPDAQGGGPAPDLDGFTGAQRFFLGYSRLWRAKERDDLVRQRLTLDRHSPGRFRSDAVVNNLDEFYTTFDVKPGDPMYLPPEQRIRLW